jgi:HD-GYP domain-containing protein (c-di-GMP phosphodiesterase class II)
MMLVPQHILESTGPLTTADRFEVLKHPLYIANALSNRNDISHNAKATAYQIHERMNGSGYPRKRQHPQIHPFARIGAVADTYLAMVSPRNGRSGLSPYDAVEKLLYATRIGLFDPAVMRALLHAVSLFPVGSVVTLSDGRSARVSRANHSQYDRPVVEILSDDAYVDGEIVDLADEPMLQVVGAGQLVAV